MAIKVFVGTSLDGYIADRDDGLGFLETVPNPDGDDLGFVSFMEGVDAVLMGRRTLDVVLGLGGAWPYAKPVFVLSSSLKRLPDRLAGKAEIVSGGLRDVLAGLQARGFRDLYIDGGMVVQSCLAEDMVDELVVTQVPVLVGGGTLLFGALSAHLEFELVHSRVLLQALVQSHYRRKR